MNHIMIAALCLSIYIAPAFAARAKAKAPALKVNPGVILYNEGKYREALPLLLETIKANPADPLYHYYLGCCYDRLHSEGSAMGQFLWVSKHSKDARLKSYAETALHGKSSTTASSSSSSTSSSSSSSSSSTSDSTDSTTSSASETPENKESKESKADAVTSSSLPYGRATVLFFESNSVESQQFAPIFENASRVYHAALHFQILDVSNQATRSEVAKYKVTTFPHLIYLDGKGRELYNEGPRTFNLRLRELLGR